MTRGAGLLLYACDAHDSCLCGMCAKRRPSMRTIMTSVLATIAVVAFTHMAAAQERGAATDGMAMGSSQPGDATAAMRALLRDGSLIGYADLSENSYDFNAPDGVPGFGPMEPDAGQRRVARANGE
jgi:hypothetical protein